MVSVKEIAVLIPARNEELLLGRCLNSVIVAIGTLTRKVRATIVLVSDCSTDRTAELARALIGSQGSVLHTHAGTVGAARALAASYAITRSSVDPSDLWFANTDADCIVPPDWLYRQTCFAASATDAVAGIVDVDNFEEHGLQVPARFKATYLIPTDRPHCHIHGANLGVRADRYVEAGGWADLEAAEDHDLWGRLKRTDARLLSSSALKVVTSGRRLGRAPNGFAAALAAHNDPAYFG